jgi:hypothetical protein
MNRAQVVLSVLALTLLSGLVGCDVAVVAILATKGKKSNSTSTPPPPDLSYALWVANFASPAAAAAEAGNLDSNGGNPSSAIWHFVGRGTQTQIWSGLLAGNNTVLIQGPLTQAYNIDTFERLDANGAVVEVPTSSNVYANSTVNSKASAAGVMDGKQAVTVTTDPTHIPCIFALFTQPLNSVRIRLWGASQTSGDCVWFAHEELSNSVVIGGTAANSSGTLYTTFLDPSASPAPQTWLLPINPDGTLGSLWSVSTSANASGSMSVALDSSGNLFMASNLSNGNILLQKYLGGATPAQWPANYSGVTAAGVNVVGPHGLAVASNVPLLTSSGTNGTAIFLAAGQGTTGSHTVARYEDIPNLAPPPPFVGSQAWTPSTVADPASHPTTWSGIAISGSSDVLTTGNLTNSGTGNIEILTEDRALASASGTVNWPTTTPLPTTGGGAATNNGNAIGADGQGFSYVAGFFGSTANGRDSVLLRYKVSDGSGLTTMYHNGVSAGSLSFAGANEFMDVAVDTDGTTYVVGYITQNNLVPSPGTVTSWWIGKFSPTGLVPLWSATFNNGIGNDQAVSVSLSGNFVYVTGSQTVTGPKSGLRVYKFVK